MNPRPVVHLLTGDDALTDGHRYGTSVAACGVRRVASQPPGTPIRLRQQMVQLTDDAPGLTNHQLRARPIALGTPSDSGDAR